MRAHHRWSMSRRRALAMPTLVALVLLGSSCVEQPPSTSGGSTSGAIGGAGSAGPSGSSGTTGSPDTAHARWPSADATKAENANAPDPSWKEGVQDPPPTTVEGFADRAGATPGEPVSLYIHSTQGPVVVRAYRTGWYGGAGARLVWTSAPVTAVEQPQPTFESGTRTWSAANWTPSVALQTQDWPPGDYILRLDAASGTRNVVPLTIRPTTTRDAVVIINSNTTWQAYNHWGGTSLYRGAKGPDDRAYAVSLDRPLDAGYGALNSPLNELPLVALAEKLGLPVAYVTDSDLHSVPNLLDGARAVISQVHDEYYSEAMRDALTRARDAQGTNLAFLGANAIYRHIRLAPSPIGPDRLEIDYKDASLDPITKTNPAEATSQWRNPPVPRPESVLTGGYYQCNPVKADLVAAQSDNWLLAGTGLKAGDKLPMVVGLEYDQVTPKIATPRPIEVLFHSPVTCVGVHQFSDVAYYSTQSGAGVFATGTNAWICTMVQACQFGGQDQHAAQVVTTITTSMLEGFAAGPAGRAHPARDNLDALGITVSTIRDISR